MKEFTYKSLLAQRKMALEELNQYYRDLRRYEYLEDLDIKGIELRKKIYFLIKFILKIDKIFKMRTVKIINDKSVKNSSSRIYACTHIGRYDIETALEAIGESAWFIMGDPGETYRNLDGLLLRANGVSWFDMGADEEHRFDAHTVNARQLKILTKGGNELCFPEAAWHIDPVIPVGEINPGIVRRAITTKSEIVPVGIEQYRGKYLKHYYVNIGANINLTGAQVSNQYEICEEIRSVLASLKWEIWEKYGQESRDDLKDYETEYSIFIDSIMSDTENGYTIDEINRTKYHRPDKLPPITQKEVFSFLEKLPIKKETAFLARDKIEYNSSKLLKKV